MIDYLNAEPKIKKLREAFENTTGQKAFYFDKDRKGVVLNLNYVEWLEELAGNAASVVDQAKKNEN